MPRRALMHEHNPANDDEIDARCREWRSSQKFSNGGELPSVNQCPCGNPGLSEFEVRAWGCGTLYSFPTPSSACFFFEAIVFADAAPRLRASVKDRLTVHETFASLTDEPVRVARGAPARLRR